MRLPAVVWAWPSNEVSAGRGLPVNGQQPRRLGPGTRPHGAVRCGAPIDRQKRPAPTLSFHTPGRTSTPEPPPRDRLRLGLPRRPIGRRRSEMLDPHAGSVLRTRQHISSWWQLTVHKFPGDALRRDRLAVDLHLAGAVGRRRCTGGCTNRSIAPAACSQCTGTPTGTRHGTLHQRFRGCPRQDSNLPPTA
jgi:hypothetical protein